jgi:hypothetical protein
VVVLSVVAGRPGLSRTVRAGDAPAELFSGASRRQAARQIALQGNARFQPSGFQNAVSGHQRKASPEALDHHQEMAVRDAKLPGRHPYSRPALISALWLLPCHFRSKKANYFVPVNNKVNKVASFFAVGYR